MYGIHIYPPAHRYDGGEKDRMIDERFCPQLGTPKQHNYICYLASHAGYKTLRNAVADFLGISKSKVQKTIVTVKDASEMIDWLKGQMEE